MAEKAVSRRKILRINVTQKDLAKVLHLRREIKGLDEQKKVLAEEEKALSSGLIGRLEDGIEIQHGVLHARVHNEERRIPSWKQICVTNLGTDFVQKVIEETPVSVYPRLIIE